MAERTKQENAAMDGLGKEVADVAARAALAYLDVHNLQADPHALSECTKAWIRVKLPEAMREARLAADAGMMQAAKLSFTATIVEAGIEAAKEAGFPMPAADAATPS